MRSLRWAPRLVAACVVLVAGALFAPAAAQETSADTRAEPRRVEGQVMRPAAEVADDSLPLQPVPGIWVTLHRVASDAAGPIDSVRTRTDGGYAFDYRPSGDADAVYFVSASYAGIAYFTPPLRAALVSGEDAEIAVYDTTSVAMPLTVRGRHLIVSAVDSTGERTVVEVFEVSNDSARTLVPRDGPDAAPTWFIPVPEAARDVRAGPGEVSPDAFVLSAGSVSVYAPVAPGLKQLSFSYRMPASAFPAEYVIHGGAVVLEVLLEEMAAQVEGAQLLSVEPVALEGRQFRRFLAQDVRDSAVVRVRVPSGGISPRGWYVTVLLVGIGLFMLLALLRAGMKRRKPLTYEIPRLPAEPNRPLHERLAREIADLDAMFARQVEPSDAVRSAYEARRAELKAALAEELAAPAGRG